MFVADRESQTCWLKEGLHVLSELSCIPCGNTREASFKTIVGYSSERKALRENNVILKLMAVLGLVEHMVDR